MIIFFQNILFWKKCLAYIDCFGLFTKIKKVFGTSFWSTFSAYYCHENLPFYQMTKFKCQTYFLKISNNVFLNSCLDNWWHQNFIYIFSIIFSKHFSLYDINQYLPRWQQMKFSNISKPVAISFPVDLFFIHIVM